MPKFIIKWNIGYGADYEVVEAENMEKARMLAYEQWRDAAENNADYGAEEYTRELAQDYDLEEADDD